MKKLIYLLLTASSLYSLDAQNSGCTPTLFYDILPGSADSNPKNFTELNGILYFSTLYGLWKTDGTQQGTSLVHETPFNKIKDIIVYNNQLLISTNRSYPENISELWISNGNNVVTLKQFPNAHGSYGIKDLTVANGYVIFLFSEKNGRYKLWRTDGTTNGTTIVKDIDPTNSIHYEPRALTGLGDYVFFSAGDTAHGKELWRSNGTGNGTSMVKDINVGIQPGFESSLIGTMGGEVYFKAYDGLYQGQDGLFKSDGTQEGTTYIKDFGAIDHYKTIGSKLYFTAYLPGGVDWHEPWVTDGTPTGTRKLVDINPGPASSQPSNYTQFGDRVIFAASDGIHGKELWITDGTELGTSMLKDIDPDPNQTVSSVSIISNIIKNGFIFFTAGNHSTGTELWATDGTPEGTHMVMDIYPGIKSSNPQDFTFYKGNIYFSAETQYEGRELWSCQFPLSTDELSSNNSISIYPNPVKNEIHFSEYLNQIQIFDLSGKQVISHTNSTQKLNVNHLTNGTYILNGTKQNGKKIKQKFIKQ